MERAGVCRIQDELVDGRVAEETLKFLNLLSQGIFKVSGFPNPKWSNELRNRTRLKSTFSNSVHFAERI